MKSISLILHLALVLIIIATSTLFKVFMVDQVIAKPLSSFTYGIAVEKEAIPNETKLVSGPWVGSRWNDENEKWLKQFQNTPSFTNHTPYLNLYTIAGMASAKKSLKDCNVGADSAKTLCVGGANFIRQYKAEILQSYKDTATAIKKNYGTDKTIFLHFEPDFYQYNSNSQKGGGLSFDELTGMMNSYTDIFKKELPKAQLVMDVSAWNSDLKGWSAKFRNFDFVGLVGRRFEPTRDIKNSKGNFLKTYKQIVQETGKKLIINDAHGPGGKWLTYNKQWENQELVKARFDDGVVAVIQPPVDNRPLALILQPSLVIG
jgi:hypothetical protein